MGKRIDLTGKQFNKLKVIEDTGKRTKNGGVLWKCQCECGNTVEVVTDRLKSGHTKSCGCIAVEDLTGHKFGRLTVICEAGREKSGHVVWKCKCDCGNETTVRGSRLKNGYTQSCGCIGAEMLAERSTKHGLEHTRIYRIWHGMNARCYNQNHNRYHRYGGRGITVCDEWRNNLQAFYDWAMANGYSDDLSIDRIDPDGNYEPSNCRWATPKEQANNKSKKEVVNAK